MPRDKTNKPATGGDMLLLTADLRKELAELKSWLSRLTIVTLTALTLILSAINKLG